MADEERDKKMPPYEEWRRTLEGDALKFEPDGNDVTFRFANRAAASHFLHWLSNIGEQDYWESMRYREREEAGPITGLRFRYHEPGHGTVNVECGRLDDPER